MSNTVPESWMIESLDRKVDILSGYPFKSSLFCDDPTKMGIIRIRDLVKQRLETFYAGDFDELYVVRKGDILIGMDGDFNIVKWKSQDALLNQRICKVKASNNSGFDSDFLFYSLIDDLEKIHAAAGATTVKHLSVKDIRGIEKTYPPLPEQQKIAAILSSVDDVIEKTRAQIDKLKDLKTGMMQELLTKGIGPDGKPHTEFKDSPVGRIPVGWEVYPLTEISSFRRGSFPQPYGLPEWYSDSGYPFVQVYDIADNGRLKPSTKVRITDSAASKSVFVPKGSVAISIQGSIGRVAITQYDAYFDRTILIFTKLHSNVYKEYFAMMVGEIFRVKKDAADGGVIKTITKETLKDFLLKLPPLDEQVKISKILGEMDKNIRLKEEKFSRLQSAKKALMQDLLTGKVRVNVEDKEAAVG